MITASRLVSQRGAKQLWEEISKTGGGEVVGPGSRLPRMHPGSWVFRRRSEGHLGRSRPGCTGHVQINTRSRGGGSVSSSLHTYPGLVSVSPGCFQRCFPFPQLGLLPCSLICLSTASSCTECSSNVFSPALKCRHKSAIKASNSETMVNVCVCV